MSGASELLAEGIGESYKFYEKLDAIVCGKAVMVARPTGGSSQVESLTGPTNSTVVVRLNNDRRPCDIFATTFFEGIDVSVPTGTKLIVDTVPNAEIECWDPSQDAGVTVRDWRPEHNRYHGGLPRATVTPEHWRLLSLSMPIFPLSGLVLLSMLAMTRMERCDISGFNFYTDMSRREFYDKVGHRFTPVRPCFLMHDYVASIQWLERLIAVDRRFHWHETRSLEEIRLETERRIAWVTIRQPIAKLNRRARNMMSGWLAS